MVIDDVKRRTLYKYIVIVKIFRRKYFYYLNNSLKLKESDLKQRKLNLMDNVLTTEPP